VSEAPGYPAARHEFLLRRLHSLAGLVPVGAFLIFHLSANAGIVMDKTGDFYQHQVNLIHSLGPMLIPVEFIFIFFPLAFHAGLGVKMWLQGAPNASHYQYWGNIRYTLQRITGVVAILFIGAHLWQMHWLANRLPGGGLFEHEQAAGTTAWILQHYAVWAGPVYLVGILCAVFHFANGVWTSLITWGITVGPNAQRKAGYVCAALGIALALAGTSSLWGFMRFGSPVEPKKVRSHGESRVEPGESPRDASPERREFALGVNGQSLPHP
jgi:succinate dehydrogenase / fumarate reductase, cytochrome b subunit